MSKQVELKWYNDSGKLVESEQIGEFLSIVIDPKSHIQYVYFVEKDSGKVGRYQLLPELRITYIN